MRGKRRLWAGAVRRQTCVVTAMVLLASTVMGVAPSVAGVRPVSERVQAAVDGMTLTPREYREFVDSYDRSHVPFATARIEFDKDRVAIRQGESRVFIWHFTVLYFNRDGVSRTPEGTTAVRNFVRYLAERGNSYGDRRCCGINWLLGRTGRVSKLAALNAKLRHNPPYDSISTGVEVEAGSQDDITSRQYEQLVYLTIHVLNRQGLLRERRLSRIVKGHGEMRDEYLAEHPGSALGPRDDFDAPVSQLLRSKINTFLKKYPRVAR